LITPNADEAARLSGAPVKTMAEARAVGCELAARYRTAVLLKGGHIACDKAIDLLFLDGDIHEFSAPFTPGVRTHGTGCAYSAAIAANLALGRSLLESVSVAKSYVSRAIAQHFSWPVGDPPLHALNHAARLEPA
jgi:hydroxymethylpyrimidine/phosphomethylpyrimidine kinase